MTTLKNLNLIWKKEKEVKNNSFDYSELNKLEVSLKRITIIEETSLISIFTIVTILIIYILTF